ncbi:hypothetical protein L596_012121 [Steinernema carpocapsae]|uniref:Protein kinase domain-containing protein n=1 Tax=Steinernema carpocapsae TaxID=34508 RepID=A0A4U5NWW6_STECR|nr:hypothetical protein L596_012121 [Steinernema carpocapsae]
MSKDEEEALAATIEEEAEENRGCGAGAQAAVDVAMMPSTSATLLMVSSPASSASSSPQQPSAESPSASNPKLRSRSRTPAGRPSESEDDVDTSGVKFRKELFTWCEDEGVHLVGEDVNTLARGSVIELVSKETEHGDLWRGRCEGKEVLFKKDAVIKIGEVPQQIPRDALEICEEIGSGGFAVVYRAKLRRKNGLEKIVAFKKPNYTLADVDDIKKVKLEMEHEAGICNALRHENIVRLEGICLEEPLGVILEYCHGGRLKDVYAKLPDVSAKIIIDWASQIAEGMHWVHHGSSTAYFHRDLTTTNILVKQAVCTCNVANPKRLSDMYDHVNIRHDGRCAKCRGTACNRLTLKISDFGMARSERDQKSGCGTVAYQAPEVIVNKQSSATSDTYSFGVVIWELFTKCVPFKGYEEGTLMYLLGTEKITPPIPDDCPPVIKQLLNDCWEQEPENRPDFVEIRERLKALKREFGTVDDGLNTFQKSMRHEIEKKMSNYAKNVPKGRDHDRLIKDNDAAQQSSTVFNSIGEYIKGIVSQTKQQRPKDPKKRPKIGKTEISHPSNFEHKHSVVKATGDSSPNGSPSQIRRVNCNDQDTLFFTLPRNPKKDAAMCQIVNKMRTMSEDCAAKCGKDFSKSTPNLAAVGLNHSPPLQSRDRAPTHSHLFRCNAVRKHRPSKNSLEGHEETWSIVSHEGVVEEITDLSTIDDSCVTVADEIPDVVVTDVSGACSSDDRDDWSRVSFPIEDNDEDLFHPGLRARRDQTRFDSTDDSFHDAMSYCRSTAGRSSSVASLVSYRSNNISLTPTSEMYSPRKCIKSPLTCLSKIMLQAGTVLAAPTGYDIKKHATPEGEVPSTSDFGTLSRLNQQRLSGSHFKSPGFEGSPKHLGFAEKSKHPKKPAREEQFQRTDQTKTFVPRHSRDHPSPSSSANLNDFIPVTAQPPNTFSSPVRHPPANSAAPMISNHAYVTTHHERARSATEERSNAVVSNVAYVGHGTRIRSQTTASPKPVTSPTYFPTDIKREKPVQVGNPAYFPLQKAEVPRTLPLGGNVPVRPRNIADPYQRLTTGSDDVPSLSSLDSPVPVTTPLILAPAVPTRPATLDFNKTSSMESGICTAESSTILSSTRDRSLSPPRERPPPPPSKVSPARTPPPVPPRRNLGQASASPPALPPKSSPRLGGSSPSHG